MYLLYLCILHTTTCPLLYTSIYVSYGAGGRGDGAARAASPCRRRRRRRRPSCCRRSWRACSRTPPGAAGGRRARGACRLALRGGQGRATCRALRPFALRSMPAPCADFRYEDWPRGREGQHGVACRAPPARAPHPPAAAANGARVPCGGRRPSGAALPPSAAARRVRCLYWYPAARPYSVLACRSCCTAAVVTPPAVSRRARAPCRRAARLLARRAARRDGAACLPVFLYRACSPCPPRRQGGRRDMDKQFVAGPCSSGRAEGSGTGRKEGTAGGRHHRTCAAPSSFSSRARRAAAPAATVSICIFSRTIRLPRCRRAACLPSWRATCRCRLLSMLLLPSRCTADACTAATCPTHISYLSHFLSSLYIYLRSYRRSFLLSPHVAHGWDLLSSSIARLFSSAAVFSSSIFFLLIISPFLARAHYSCFSNSSSAFSSMPARPHSSMRSTTPICRLHHTCRGLSRAPVYTYLFSYIPTT